jgi:hypothetical protein
LSFLLQFELALLPWNRPSVPCPYQESAAKEGSLGHQPSDVRDLDNYKTLPAQHFAHGGELLKGEARLAAQIRMLAILLGLLDSSTLGRLGCFGLRPGPSLP